MASKAGEIMKMVDMTSDGQRYSIKLMARDESRTAPMYNLTSVIVDSIPL